MLGILVETTRRIEDTVARGFDNINAQLSRLPETYVNRREFDRYRDEIIVDWQAAQLKHEADIKKICEDVAANEARRIARGRYVVTTLIALAAVLVALAALVLAHL